MTTEFRDHIEKFVTSLNDDVPTIYYQAFDFAKVQDNRWKLLSLNYDKQKVSVLNLEMVGEAMVQFRFTPKVFR